MRRPELEGKGSTKQNVLPSITFHEHRLTITGLSGEDTKKSKTQADGQVSYSPVPAYIVSASTGPALVTVLQPVCDIFGLLSK